MFIALLGISLGSSLFRVGNIVDWSGFCSRLIHDVNEDSPNPGKRIWNLLPQEIRSLIESSIAGPHFFEEDKSKIINALNDLLERQDFFQKQNYSSTALPEKAKELLVCNRNGLSTRDVQKLNRLLIEAAYPHETAKSRLFFVKLDLVGQNLRI